MSTNPTQHHGTLQDWIDLHPRPIGLLRLMITLGLLGLLSLVGTIIGSTQVAAARDASGCTYQAEEANPPLSGQTAETGSAFGISWKIRNTGSCQIWGTGVALVRRADAIASDQAAYAIKTDQASGLNVLSVVTQMTAPDQPGVYETAWQMQAPNGQAFGPVMTRRVQVYPAGQPQPNPPRNQDFINLTALFQLGVSLLLYPLPAAFAILLVLWRGADFLQNVYQLKSLPMSHISGMMFGGNAGHLRVRSNKSESDSSTAAMEMIGGPIWLTVTDRTAALTERGAKLARILGPGVHLLHAHERVRGVVDLQIQHRRQKQKTLSKDGIPLELDVDLTFRVGERDIEGEAPPPPPPPIGPRARIRLLIGLPVSPMLLEASKPHRFSREAIRRIVYETPIASPDAPTDWTAGFTLMRTGELAKEFAERRLDDLSSPEDPDIHPLREIVEGGLTKIRAEVAPSGIDILNMEIGIVEPPADIKGHVTEQRISNWMIEWKRRATILKSEGDAIAMQAQEEAHAEAQANMIQALTEGFRIATAGNASVSSEVIAMRFIDALEALMHSQPEKQTANDREEEQPDQAAQTMLIVRQNQKE
ncbi:MAG TPA: NBR1-Ig-like domain-containing protein [Anaerolineae bacterium]|nr:NBR1-Ig-like domain-containing protein [Anaerolineae bacterium]